MTCGRDLLTMAIAAALLSAACGEGSRPEAAMPAGPVELAHFPIGAGQVPPGSAATFDPDVSRDGGGSLRIETSEGGRLRLYELDDLGPMQGQVTLTGFLRSRGLRGKAMLELRCQPGEGDEAFVRGLRRSAAGDSDWTAQEIRFSDPALCRDPVLIQINLLIQGSGTVWVDDLRLWSVPLE